MNGILRKWKIWPAPSEKTLPLTSYKLKLKYLQVLRWTHCVLVEVSGQQQSTLAHNMSNEGRRKLYPQKHKDSFSATWQIILLVLKENFVRLLNSRDFKLEFYLNLYSEVNEFPSTLTGWKVFLIQMRFLNEYSFAFQTHFQLKIYCLKYVTHNSTFLVLKVNIMINNALICSLFTQQ